MAPTALDNGRASYHYDGKMRRLVFLLLYSERRWVVGLRRIVQAIDIAGARRVARGLSVLGAAAVVAFAVRAHFFPLVKPWEFAPGIWDSISAAATVTAVIASVIYFLYRRTEIEDRAIRHGALSALADLVDRRGVFPLAALITVVSLAIWIFAPPPWILARLDGKPPDLADFICNSQLKFGPDGRVHARLISEAGVASRGADHCGGFRSGGSFRELTLFQGAERGDVRVVIGLGGAPCVDDPDTQDSATAVYFSDAAVESGVWNDVQFLRSYCLVLSQMSKPQATIKIRFAFAYPCSHYPVLDAKPRVDLSITVRAQGRNYHETIPVDLSDIHRRRYEDTCRPSVAG